MRPLIFGKIHELHELNNFEKTINANKRNRIPILIIDDENFMYLEELRNEQFNLMQIKDIEDFKTVAAYPVVICDVKGVGHKFNEKKEGLYVVESIKKLYPFKQVAVYSSGYYEVSALSHLKGIEWIQKDAEKDMWCNYCDTLIQKASDPIYIWKSIRSHLLREDMDIKEVMFLESDYVKMVKYNPKKLVDFPSRDAFPNIKEDARAVIQSMIAGGLLKLLGV